MNLISAFFTQFYFSSKKQYYWDCGKASLASANLFLSLSCALSKYKTRNYSTSTLIRKQLKKLYNQIKKDLVSTALKTFSTSTAKPKPLTSSDSWMNSKSILDYAIWWTSSKGSMKPLKILTTITNKMKRNKFRIKMSELVISQPKKSLTRMKSLPF